MLPSVALVIVLAGAVSSPACAKRDSASGSARTTGAPERESSAPSAPSGAAAPSSAADAARPRAFAERVAERESLVRSLEREGIHDQRVLRALRRVPRHRFVPNAVRGMAYVDRPLGIGWGQTISQPYVVAAMTEAVAPKPSDRCLEIGTGSGYQAAVLSELCARTYSIEYLPELAQFARENLSALGYAVELRQGDGFKGWPDAAPFDVIVVTAAPERVPPPLLDQLRREGRLVIPVGREDEVQKLELWTRIAEGKGTNAFERRTLADVRFVPFLGDGGT
jgi:protein-L-isoaspartate(D-aspartate) O-methyltransferase